MHNSLLLSALSPPYCFEQSALWSRYYCAPHFLHIPLQSCVPLTPLPPPTPPRGRAWDVGEVGEITVAIVSQNSLSTTFIQHLRERISARVAPKEVCHNIKGRLHMYVHPWSFNFSENPISSQTSWYVSKRCVTTLVRHNSSTSSRDGFARAHYFQPGLQLTCEPYRRPRTARISLSLSKNVDHEVC